MGVLRNLEEGWANSVEPPEFVAWADAISDAVDNFVAGGGAQANTRYVSLGGNDATGNGSFELPYLTIAKAISTITTASVANPWLVNVGPGVFPNAFTVKNGVTVKGASSGPGNAFGAPAMGATIVAPHTVQILDASFAGGADTFGAIVDCTFSTDLQANFGAIGSTGQGNFYLGNIITQNDVIFVGAGAAGTSMATIRNLTINQLADLRLIDMLASDISGFLSDFGGNLLYSQSAAIQSFHDITGSFASFMTVTWASAAVGNFLLLTASTLISNNEPVLTGVGVIFICNTSRTITMPNAAARLAFGNDAASTLLGINGGRNLIECTPTANRVLSISPPNSITLQTTIVVRNLAVATFNIDLSLLVTGIAAGSPTYVPPGGQVNILFDFANQLWIVTPYVQAGSVVLAGGVSAAIPADITARSAITAALKTFSGAAGGLIQAKATDRVIGTRAGGGSFKLTSVAPATGATVATDTGTYDWQIAG